ncbi:MAG: thioredoxin family protein [Bacteroidia bacterium]|nr:thioredoxin family protein [Bacteroidia bacterium]MDW8333623.1 thioredoxin family protein [Bacteroidia bacterium]
MSVIQIDDENFEKTLSEHPVTVVKYYADWCGTCRLIAPKYSRWAQEGEPGVAFAESNAEKNPGARRAAGVDNLPFFAIFKDGKQIWGAATSKLETVREALKTAVGT